MVPSGHRPPARRPRALALAVCALFRAALAVRRSRDLRAAGSSALDVRAAGSFAGEALAVRRSRDVRAAGSFAGEGFVAEVLDGDNPRQGPRVEEERTAFFRGPWAWRQLVERFALPDNLNELLMQHMPIRYHWIALRKANAREARLGVWEVAVSFRGEWSDHLRLVGELMPCEAFEGCGFNFAAFLPRGDVMIACRHTFITFFLEIWRIPSRQPAHCLEHKFFQPGEYDPHRPSAVEHRFSHASPRREWFVGDTQDGAGMWNTTSWRMLWQNRGILPLTLAFSPDGDRFAAVEPYRDSTERLAIVDIATGRELCGVQLAETRLATRGIEHRLGFSGTHLTVCDPYGGTSAWYRLYDLQGRGCRLKDTGQRRPCCDATGNGFVLYGSRKQLSIGTMGSTAKTPLFQTTFTHPFLKPRLDCAGARFSPDGRSALFRDRARWYMWPFADGGPPRPVPYSGMVFSDDGALLVGFGKAGFSLMDTRSGSELSFGSELNATRPSPADYEELVAVSGARDWRPWPAE